MTEARILVLDDEHAIRILLERGLASYGYTVMATGRDQEALEAASRQPPDITLLDVNLEANTDGRDICRRIRDWSKTPIIMLTICDEKQIKPAALNAGADDDVTKPFDMQELGARIRAVLRRNAHEGSRALPDMVHVQDLTIDLVNRRVHLKGDEVHLTPGEFGLLKLLASNPAKVLTFRALPEQVCGPVDSARPEHNIRVYVNTLRQKLKDDLLTTRRPRVIFNEPGIGYRFVDVKP